MHDVVLQILIDVGMDSLKVYRPEILKISLIYELEWVKQASKVLMLTTSSPELRELRPVGCNFTASEPEKHTIRYLNEEA